MIRTPSIGRVFLVQMTCYPSFVLVVGLWGGPYLTHIYGYDLKGRGEILFVAALMQVFGAFVWGPSDRVFGRYKAPILLGTVMSFVALVLLATLGMLAGAAAGGGVRAARVLDRHGLGGDGARPFARAAASARADHHAAEHRDDGRRLPGRNSSAGPSSTCFQARAGPTRWRPTSWFSPCRRYWSWSGESPISAVKTAI